MEHLIRIWMYSCVDSCASASTLCLSRLIMYLSQAGKCICSLPQNAGGSDTMWGADYFCETDFTPHKRPKWWKFPLLHFWDFLCNYCPSFCSASSSTEPTENPTSTDQVDKWQQNVRYDHWICPVWGESCPSIQVTSIKKIFLTFWTSWFQWNPNLINRKHVTNFFKHTQVIQDD